jgi:hypothetical protein
LKSNNFTLDGINFGSLFPLISTQATPPSISSEGPTVVEINHNSVTITWKTDKKSTSLIKYGKTTSYGLESGVSELTTDHSVTVSGLEPETKYHYKAVSEDSTGAKGESGDKTFTTTAESGISGIKITDIGYDRALVTWKTGNFTSSKIEYGTTTKYGQSKTSASRSFLTTHTVQLTALTPGTEYHLQIEATNEKGEKNLSSDFSFTTIDEPKFDSITPKVLSPNIVEITWKTNTFTGGLITYSKEGETEERTTGTEDRNTTHVTKIISLIGDSTYFFTITATDVQGKQVTSNKLSFHTAVDKEPPKIDKLKVKVTRSGNELVLTATWTTDEPSNSEAVLRSRSTSTAVEVPEQGTITTDHILVKSGIDPAVTYDLTVESADPYGNKSQADINFISPTVRKSIIALIIESVMKPFGWLARLFQ